MKLNIIFSFRNTAYGGGNQFLNALKKQLIRTNNYCEDPSLADIFIFNSHHNQEQIKEYKNKYNKPLIHRLDGLPKLYNSLEDSRQNIIFDLNRKYADGSIFQSNWAFNKHQDFGLKVKDYSVIYNSCDPEIFYPISKNNNKKIRLITTSWSQNKNKGFHYLSYLDKMLDFSIYDYTFVGNSPITFKNIRCISPVESTKVNSILNQHDIFISGTKNDACSNSIIEALTCKLPVIALNSGGSPELILGGGELFNTPDQLLEYIKKVSSNIGTYINKININSISKVTKLYLDYAENILNKYINR
jgi:glycosyltransferase involved in cell wall biosynthesis